MSAEYTLVVRRYAPFKSFGGGYKGDDRLFSTDMGVTARTVGLVTFSPTSGPVKGAGYSTGSEYIGPWAIRENHRLGAVNMSVGQVQVTVTRQSSGAGKVAFTVETSGDLPMLDLALKTSIVSKIDRVKAALKPGSPKPEGSPDIDTYIDFKAIINKDEMIVEGVMRGDSFPNAEVFLRDSSAPPISAPLLDYRTSGGIAGPLRLITSHPGARRATFKKTIPLNPDGLFAPSGSGPPIIVQE